MNEEELREALRREMATITPPAPSSSATTLRAARKALVRRRSAWACAGSAAVVLAVTGATVGVPGFFGSGGLKPAGLWPQPAPHPSASDTAQPWPTGLDGRPQEDRTARAGDRYDQGARLLDAVLSVVPARYTVENPVNQSVGQPSLRSHQAQFEERVGGVEVWSYLASVALFEGQRTGRLLVEVHTAENRLPEDPCALAQKFWGMRGECQVEVVGAAQVGVVARPSGDDRFDQWAAYRHPDGVVVFVAQGMRFDDERPQLTDLPFTVPELAALAIDDRFHLQ